MDCYVHDLILTTPQHDPVRQHISSGIQLTPYPAETHIKLPLEACMINAKEGDFLSLEASCIQAYFNISD